MANLIESYKVVIRESHLDTFGHVNNAVYLSLYEEARWDLITRRGYSLNKIQETKKGPVILEANVKFLKELKLREEIDIQTSSLDYKGLVGHLEQKIFNQKGELASIAIFAFGLFDLNTRKLLMPTDEWFYAIGFQ